jgi:hypothetical protein
MRAAALDAVFASLSRVDDGEEPRPDGRSPGAGWCLVCTDSEGRPTSQVLHRLREDLLAQDPSGRAGVDLRR